VNDEKDMREMEGDLKALSRIASLLQDALVEIRDGEPDAQGIAATALEDARAVASERLS
jgi:hypothetical protein